MIFKAVILLLAVVAYTAAAPYVVNGTDANIEEYPHMVSIRSFGSHNCGGSVLNHTVILTAAHCSGDTVQYGVDFLSSDPTTVVAVKNWIRHENYDGFTLQNDIALVVLSQPLIYSTKVQPVKLPPRFFEVPGNWDTPATLTGFGLNSSSGIIQSRLQKATLFVVNNTDCDSRHTNKVYDSMLCAGIREGGKGQCSGDSGGPLILQQNINEVPAGTQVGIVSWSMKPCTIAPYPGVYTKLSHHIDWVQNKMRTL